VSFHYDVGKLEIFPKVFTKDFTKYFKENRFQNFHAMPCRANHERDLGPQVNHSAKTSRTTHFLQAKWLGDKAVDVGLV